MSVEETAHGTTFNTETRRHGIWVLLLSNCPQLALFREASAR
jgi:hypothetical protein